jgi:hypothetical protein
MYDNNQISYVIILIIGVSNQISYVTILIIDVSNQIIYVTILISYVNIDREVGCDPVTVDNVRRTEYCYFQHDMNVQKPVNNCRAQVCSCPESVGMCRRTDDCCPRMADEPDCTVGIFRKTEEKCRRTDRNCYGAEEKTGNTVGILRKRHEKC